MKQLASKLSQVKTVHKLVAVALFCLPFVGLVASLGYLAIVTR